jgi:alpha-L-fucosidase
LKNIIVAFFILLSSTVFAQSYTPAPENLAARQQFQDAKFGLFIHWGLSSMLGANEWVMNNRNIQVVDYRRLQQAFYPHLFNADEWVTAAKNAGMRYIVFVSRHHDGFSNWDTKYSDWKITNTPYGKDVLKQLAEACQRQGMKLGLYYSTLDWFREDYPHETGRTGKGTGRTGKGNYASYLSFMKNQLTELLTNYGPIMSVWLDGHWDQTNPEGHADRTSRIDWKYDELYSLIHRLQPACLIGNNHHLTPFPGEDFQLFEKDLPGQNKNGLSFQEVSQSMPLETCETMNNSWGYNITDKQYKSTKTIIDYLVRGAGVNANLLLNVGPMPSGKIQPEFLDTLKKVGAWTKQYGKALYNTRGKIIADQEWGVVVGTPTAQYVHILACPADGIILLPNWNGRVAEIHLFESDEKLRFEQTANELRIFLDQYCKKEKEDLILVLTQTTTKK